jgi:hypothetical protein
MWVVWLLETAALRLKSDSAESEIFYFRMEKNY